MTIYDTNTFEIRAYPLNFRIFCACDGVFCESAPTLQYDKWNITFYLLFLIFFYLGTSYMLSKRIGFINDTSYVVFPFLNTKKREKKHFIL